MDTRQYLLKSSEIDSMEGELITHFLNPNAIRFNKSLGQATGMSEMGVHMIYVEPGMDSTEYHKHLYEEECIYILSGIGKLILDGDEYEVVKGDFIGLPANQVAHELSNSGTDTLICLVMGQRLKHDIADYPNKEKRIYRHNGNAEVVEHKDISYPKIHTAREEDK
ncbi:MAG: cupin domain-containing protein [Cocleimonas sp.]|nr:cupin domain-containing protein [Cocleimonas sp.]